MMHLLAVASGVPVQSAGIVLLVIIALIIVSQMVLVNATEPAEVQIQSGMWRFDFTEGDGSGVIASCPNPEGVDVWIKRAIVVITTPSTGASTLDIGVAAAIGTANDTLIDGLSGATAGVFDNEISHGTNGVAGLLWDSANFLTIAEASGDVVGLEGYILIDYVRIDG